MEAPLVSRSCETPDPGAGRNGGGELRSETRKEGSASAGWGGLCGAGGRETQRGEQGGLCVGGWER